MEISFVIEWASVLIGFVLGLLTFFAGALAIAYRMKKSELSEVYKASGKQKK
jgi:ABC-type antimicrobial peptide transport system permease subunit